MTVTRLVVQLPGSVPHIFRLLVAIRRVRLCMPPGEAHEAGRVEVRALTLKSSCAKEPRALHASGTAPLSELLPKRSSVSRVREDQDAGREPLKVLPVICTETRVVTHRRLAGSKPVRP